MKISEPAALDQYMPSARYAEIGFFICRKPRPAYSGALSRSKHPLRHCEPAGRGNPAGGGYSEFMGCRVATLLAMTGWRDI